MDEFLRDFGVEYSGWELDVGLRAGLRSAVLADFC